MTTSSTPTSRLKVNAEFKTAIHPPMSTFSLLAGAFLLSSSLVKKVTSVTDDECTTSACVKVQNNCGETLYLDRTNIDDTNGEDGTVKYVTTLTSGESTILDVSGWTGLPGQRIYAFWKDPTVYTNISNTKYADKVEINICQTDPVTYCYNPTAVDYFALPVEIGPANSDDCYGIPQTGTPGITLQVVQQQCPTSYVSYPPYGVCLSPSMYCSLYSNETLCSDLDSSVNTCINDGICSSGTTTENAYACSGYFADQAGYCASINRGVYPNLNQDDSSVFYQNVPFNKYAAWIHASGSLEYAFPYDDYGDTGSSGYNSCQTDLLSVIWCPSG